MNVNAGSLTFEEERDSVTRCGRAGQDIEFPVLDNVVTRLECDVCMGAKRNASAINAGF